jgi:hypothetical protein
LSTKKHNEKEQEIQRLSIVYPNFITPLSSNENEFRCIFCNNIYSNAQNLSRHKNYCQVKQELIKDHENKVKELEDKLKEKDLIINAKNEEIKNKNTVAKTKESAYINEIKVKDDLIAFVKSENRNLRVLLNNAGTVIKTSVSTFSYIVKNYNEAPALEYIQDVPKLHFELSTNDFVEQLIHEYKHDTLISYIGDIILKYCKKGDPKQQSIWNSDTSRLTYIIREIMHNQNLDWRVDKKGLKTIKLLIEPVLDEYLHKSKVGKRSDPTSKLVNTMHNFHDINKVIQLIDDKILEDELLKYLAPHLYLVKGDELLLEE